MKPKTIKILYWIINGLFGGFMIFSAIPDIMEVPEAVQFMTMLGYPTYFTPFIGVAKVLGVIAILIPGFPRLKEWAYAGLMFDLIGATYSVIAIGTAVQDFWMMFLFLGFGGAAYFTYRKKQALETTAAVKEKSSVLN
jgi:uncharacterized membrane protein YphA (DoxX/SURF4 family)